MQSCYGTGKHAGFIGRRIMMGKQYSFFHDISIPTFNAALVYNIDIIIFRKKNIIYDIYIQN